MYQQLFSWNTFEASFDAQFFRIRTVQKGLNCKRLTYKVLGQVAASFIRGSQFNSSFNHDSVIFDKVPALHNWTSKHFLFKYFEIHNRGLEISFALIFSHILVIADS